MNGRYAIRLARFGMVQLIAGIAIYIISGGNIENLAQGYTAGLFLAGMGFARTMTGIHHMD